MNIHALKKIAVQQGGLFSLQQLQLYEPDFLRSNLIRRTQQGYIKRVTKGRYCLADSALNEHIFSTYSNRLYTPSYISMESALRYYDLIPEGVYITTACTTKKTQQFTGDIGVFTYAHLKPTLFRGYALIQTGGYSYNLAQVEKAFCDFLYLKPHILTAHDIEELRIDTQRLWELTTPTRLHTCAQAFSNKRVSTLIQFLSN